VKIFSPHKLVEVSEILTSYEEEGFIPVGILAFSVERDKFDMCVFKSMDVHEVSALLEKINIRITYRK
jgi:hypothetical protein